MGSPGARQSLQQHPGARYNLRMTAAPRFGSETCRPPFESGDMLSRDEFERIYELYPEIKKAELIQGIVYVGSPVRTPEHAEPENVIGTWLGNYAITHPGVRAANNGTVRLGPEDEPQPDVMLFREAGQSRIDDESYVAGAPELAAEVAASTANIAMHRKKESYRRAGVQEYIVWLTLDERFLWYRLRDGKYVELRPGPDGVIRSEIFPGLEMNVARLLDGDYSVALPPR